MARRLSARWVRLEEGREAEYLGLIGAVKAGVVRAGGHLWLFRHPVLREVFLEFREGSGQAPAGPEDIEARLRSLGEYTPDADVVWEEIPLEEPSSWRDASSK